MLVFSCLPSRLESRTHSGAYAEWSSGLSGLSVGLLIGRLPSRYAIPQLGRFVCAVVMLPVHAGATPNRGKFACPNEAVKQLVRMRMLALGFIPVSEMD